MGADLIEAKACEFWGDSDHLTGSLPHTLMTESKWTESTAAVSLIQTRVRIHKIRAGLLISKKSKQVLILQSECLPLDIL